MKKTKNSELNDWGKAEYKRSDLGELVRGKYTKHIRESTNVVVLDPKVAKAFPNDEAVNNALRGLIRSTRSDAKLSTKRKNKSTEKKRAA
jgi:phage terminase large subunit